MLADCPLCNSHQSVEVTTKTEKIPYFGEIMESTMLCSECGFKHAETICIDQKEPVKYTLSVGKENLNSDEDVEIKWYVNGQFIDDDKF